MIFRQSAGGTVRRASPVYCLGRMGIWGRVDRGRLSLDGDALACSSDRHGTLFEARAADVRSRVPRRTFGLGLTLRVDGRRFVLWFVPVRSLTGTRNTRGDLGLGGIGIMVGDMRPAREAVREWKVLLDAARTGVDAGST